MTLRTSAGDARAGYVVGCDGAHSAVRRLVGIDFVGTQYATHIMLADVRLANPPGDTLFAQVSAEGAVLVVPFGDGWFRAIAVVQRMLIRTVLRLRRPREALLGRLTGIGIGYPRRGGHPWAGRRMIDLPVRRGAALRAAARGPVRAGDAGAGPGHGVGAGASRPLRRPGPAGAGRAGPAGRVGGLGGTDR